MDNDDTCDESIKGVDGIGYKGCQDKTINGLSCVQWSSVSGQGNKYPASDWKHNYCRNPKGTGSREGRGEKDSLWCFTNLNGRSTESCVPKISQSDITNLTTKLENTETTLNETLNELGNANDKKHGNVKSKNTANNEKSLLEGELNITRNSLDKLRTKTSDTIDKLESDKNILATENNKFKEEKSKLESDNKRLAGANEKLENTNKKLDEINKIVEEENDDLEDENKNLEYTLDGYVPSQLVVAVSDLNIYTYNNNW